MLGWIFQDRFLDTVLGKFGPQNLFKPDLKTISGAPEIGIWWGLKFSGPNFPKPCPKPNLENPVEYPTCPLPWRHLNSPPPPPSRSPGSNLARLELDFPQSRPVHGTDLFRVRCLLPSTWLKKKKNWGDKKRTGDKGRGKGTQSTPRPLAILPTISLACISSFLRSSFFFTGAYDQFINATWRHPPTTSCLLLDTIPRLRAHYYCCGQPPARSFTQLMHLLLLRLLLSVLLLPLLQPACRSLPLSRSRQPQD